MSDGRGRREWVALSEAVRRAQPLLIFADYDGTLTPIRPTPEQARLDERTRAVLRRLSHRKGTTVGLVSGRSIGTLRRLARLPRLIYVGNHGLELEGAGVRFVHPAARRSMPVLARVAEELQDALRDMPGAIVEFKRLSLSVHWRLVPAGIVQRFRRRVRAALAPWVSRRLVRVTSGKQVIEVRPPVDWTKGSAVEWLLRACGGPRGTVVYLGDDRTDEDAFRAVNRHRGVSIFVGPRRRPTAARWRLSSPAEVGELLARIIGKPVEA